MTKRVTLGVGTHKGLFLFDGDPASGQWTAREPILPSWEVTTLLLDPADPDHLTIGTNHYAYGATVRDSRDGGRTWSQVSLQKADSEPARPIKRIWQLVRSPEPNTLYAGVDEAALYVSRDDGQTWSEVQGLSNHPSRPHWHPGNGGLCLHTILIDPRDAKRMWVGISAVGVFGTADGGETWQAMNKGLPAMVTTGSPSEDAMFCIHRMALDPTTPGRLFMQFHAHTMTPDGQRSPGIHRSDDNGQTWQPIDRDLPDRFGFPLAVSQRGEVFVIPLNGDDDRTFRDGHAAVWRTRDAGHSWERITHGLNGQPVYSGVLRDAMWADAGDPAGIYFGTTGGDVFASGDAGESWQALPARLPRISSVRAEVYGG